VIDHARLASMQRTLLAVRSVLQKGKMKIKDFFLISIVPLVLMVYGWYLGQLHQSGYDIAGILLFVTGVVGLALAFGIRVLARKYPWHAYWFVNILYGIAGCGVVFMLVVVFAMLHK
jgi:hypothetical protein